MSVATEINQKEIGTVSRGRDRVAEYWPPVLLAALGLIWSLSFWQHAVFPSPDYFGFVATGRQWLSLEVPTSMKRGPVFSVIAGLSSLLFSPVRVQVAATEMYNALLLPVSMILFYLVGRGLLGCRAALVTALLAGTSPHLVQMSSDALAEMTLVVVFAGGVLCVARGRIGWAYGFALLASLTRWDLAGLIPAAALADWARNRRGGRVLARTVPALVPFALCMAITRIRLAGQETGAHYLQVLAEERSFALAADLRAYWDVIMAWLNAPPARPVSGGIQTLFRMKLVVFQLTTVLLALTFLWGSVRAWRARRWEILVMLVTGVPYVLVHAIYPYRLSRYCVPMAWAGLIISAYGLQGLWWYLRDRCPTWSRVRPAVLASGTLLFLVWAMAIGLEFKAGVGHRVCPGIGVPVCWSIVVGIVGYLAYEWLRSAPPGWHWAMVSAFIALATVSSGARAATLIRSGQQYSTFQQLSAWFWGNAQPGDRMVTSLPDYLPVYTNLPRDRFVLPEEIAPKAAPDFPSLVRACRAMGVTLIAWDSRLADAPQDLYYRLWGLDRLSPLKVPLIDPSVNRIGSCELVQVFSEGSPRIGVWRILPEDEIPSGKTLDNQEVALPK